ncbi:hypothetical protein NX059_007641 [Plenodomus lindquistii]|nr:hypothetical protein NX059_007641 [Plenodomus lindquistii]
MTIAAHIVSRTGDTSHLTMEQRVGFTPAEAALRQTGTKWFMVGWYSYIGLIWTLKLNMLFLYRRVVSFVWVKKFIVPVMIIVGVTGVAIWILLATACRPFHKLWQIWPDPGMYCMPQSPAFLVTILVLNLTTDMCIMLIPIPIIIPLRISWGRKLGLLMMFSAGVFVMIAAILRVYFVLVERRGGVAAIWSCREDIVAVIIGQATMVRPLFTKRFWNETRTGSSAYDSSKPSQTEGSHELSGGSIPNKRVSRLGFRPVKDPYDISVLRTRGNESQEDIIPESTGHRISRKPKRGIVISREVDVSSEVGTQGFQKSWKPV